MISTQADEMNTEVMENAANAATKRREARRRRILQDPEERMRKLTGYNNSGQGEHPVNISLFLDMSDNAM